MKKVFLNIFFSFNLLYAFSQYENFYLPEYTKNYILLGNNTIKTFKISSTDKLNGKLIVVNNVDLFTFSEEGVKDTIFLGDWRFDRIGNDNYYIFTLNYLKYNHLIDDYESIEKLSYKINLNRFYLNRVKHKLISYFKDEPFVETLELSPIKSAE
jgi:hypothetical protein